MSTGMALLGLLTNGPRHGYDLKHSYDTRFPGARPLAYGQVYATLSRLTRDGLADVAGADIRSGPERTLYGITGHGHDELRDWLATPEPAQPYVANALFTKVVIALLVTGTADQYLRAQRAAHMARMRELTAIKTDPGSSVADVLSADYAVAHLDADLRWMDVTAERLDSLAQEIRR